VCQTSDVHHEGTRAPGCSLVVSGEVIMYGFRSSIEVAPLQSKGALYGFLLIGRWPQDTVEWAKFLVLAVRMAAVPGLLPLSTVFRVSEDLPDELCRRDAPRRGRVARRRLQWAAAAERPRPARPGRKARIGRPGRRRRRWGRSDPNRWIRVEVPRAPAAGGDQRQRYDTRGSDARPHTTPILRLRRLRSVIAL